MARRPDWNDRLDPLNRSFGAPPPLPTKILKEKGRNRKAVVDCNKPVSMDAPIRKLSLQRIQDTSSRDPPSSKKSGQRLRSQSAGSSRFQRFEEKLRLPRIASANTRRQTSDEFTFDHEPQTKLTTRSQRRHTLNDQELYTSAHVPEEDYSERARRHHTFDDEDFYTSTKEYEEDSFAPTRRHHTYDHQDFDRIDDRPKQEAHGDNFDDFDCCFNQESSPTSDYSRMPQAHERIESRAVSRSPSIYSGTNRSKKQLPICQKRIISWDTLNEIYTIPPVTPPPPYSAHEKPCDKDSVLISPEDREEDSSADHTASMLEKVRFDCSLEANDNEHPSTLLGSLTGSNQFNFGTQAKTFINTNDVLHNNPNSCYDSDGSYEYDFEEDDTQVKIS